MLLFKNQKKLTSSWSLIEPSVQLIRNNFVLLSIIMLIPAAAMLQAYSTVGDNLLPRSGLASVVVLIGFLWSLILLSVQFYAELHIARGEQPTFSEAFSGGMPYFFRILVLLIIMSVLILLGLLLFIIPGLILIKRFSLAPYYLIDKNTTIRGALDLSTAASKKIPGYIWGMIVVTAILSVLGTVATSLPYIGIAISFVVSFVYVMAFALRYAELEYNIEPTTYVKD